MGRHYVSGTTRETTTGQVRGGATVTVYLAGGVVPASVYAASTGGVAVNFVLSDANGVFVFYVDEADYALTQRFKIVSSKTGYTSSTFDYLPLFSLDSVDTTAALTANSDTKIPSQKAVKSYIDSSVGTSSTTFTIGSGGTTTLVLTSGTNTFSITEGTASLDIAAGATLNIDKDLTVNGYGVTLTAEDAASSITLDEQTVEFEGEGTATRLMKFVNKADAAATLTISGTSMDLVGGTNTFTINAGTASLDVAAGIDVDIDANFTVSTASTLTTELHVTAPATHIADAATGFTIAGGTTSKTLTVEDTSLLNQDLTTDASPTFATAKLSSLTDGYIPYHVADATGLANTNLFTDATKVLQGDTANAKNTAGFTINQGANDDEILSLKSSDITHTVTTDTEADTYGLLQKYSATAGGLFIRGLTDVDATGGLVLEGIIGATNPTDINTALLLIGSKQAGNTTAALSAAETVAKVLNRTTELISILGDGKTNFWITANDGTNYEGLQIDPATAGTMKIAAITAGTGTDNIDINITPAGTGSVVMPKVNISSGLVTGITDLVVADGGTGASTLTDHGVLVGSGTDPITALTALAAGEIIVGVGSADPHALAAGATTTILVGGGAADPVWTTVTGTGSPVRATSPTLVTPIIGVAAATSVTISGTSGGFKTMFVEAASGALAGATGTITLAIPAGAFIRGVQLRVDTLIEGATAWTAAFSGGNTATICTGQAVDKNTKVNSLSGGLTTNTTQITLTQEGGNFTAGAVTAIAYYDTLVALASV